MTDEAKLTVGMKGLSIPLLGVLLLLHPGERRLFAARVTPGPSAAQSQSQDQTKTAPSESSTEELSALQTELRSRPDWVEGWWKLSTLAYDVDRFDLAAPALQKVVAAAPQMGIAWDLLGLSEFELKAYSPARAHLERAATLANSDDSEVERVAAYHLALLLTRDGDFDGSTAILLKNFGSAPNAQVSYALGLAALHVPLLPGEVDPSQEALIEDVGSAVAQGNAGISRWAELVAQHGDVPYLREAYGAALERAGESQRALAVFQEEVKKDPRDALPWLSIARIERSIGDTARARTAEAKASELQRNAQPDLQRAILARYAVQSTQDVAAGWSEIMLAYSSGKYHSAAQGLTSWLRDHPEDGTAWAVLGLSEFGLQQYDSALLHLQRGEALGLHGDSRAVAMAHYTAGLLLLRAGDFEHASEILNKAHTLRPDDQHVGFALGCALLRRGGLPKESADGAVVQAAGAVQALLQESRYDEAFSAFQRLLQQYPSTPFLHYAYGTALIALSEFDEAAAQMRAELSTSPNSPLPYVRLASIALRQRKPADALSPARRAIALTPSSAEAHYLLGRALLETGEEQSAVAELEQARALNPGSPEVHYSLARAYARANRETDAAQERATFARLNELSQTQKSGDGQQTYAGPREGSTLSNARSSQTPQ